MTERFIKGYCCGDVGLVDKEKEEWFVENINSISDSERNWNDVLDKLNEVAQENEQLKKQLMENNCDNCKYSKAIYADVECRKKGLTEWKYNCDEFKGDVE